MPKISSNSTGLTAALNLPTPPSLGLADRSGKFDRALAKASSPQKGDPQPAKKLSKPKAAKPEPSVKGDGRPCDDEDAASAATKDSSDPQNANAGQAAQPTNGKADQAASDTIDDSDGQADASSDSTDLDTVASADAALPIALPDGDASAEDADADHPAKAATATSKEDPSADLLTQLSLNDSRPPQQTPATQAPKKTGEHASEVDIQIAGEKTADANAASPTPKLKAEQGASVAKQPSSASTEVDLAADVDSTTATADGTIADESPSAPAAAVTKATRKSETSSKKNPLTPGEMRPVAQGPSPLAAAVAPIDPLTATVNSQSTGAQDSEKAIEAVDADAATDGSDAKAIVDVPLDPTQLLTADKPAVHATVSSFASHLSSTASAVDVAANNHDKIVQVVRSELTPGGGTMKIRLDPPEFGALQVTVKMSGGVMTASFETSTDQATKMLSHSLGQLKTALESSGVSVEKLHVQQSPKDTSADAGGGSKDDSRRDQMRGSDDSSQQQREQQRKEMIRRMWAKLGVGDPLDLVA